MGGVVEKAIKREHNNPALYYIQAAWCGKSLRGRTRLFTSTREPSRLIRNPYNPPMSRFVIEHLPRSPATYVAAPLDYEQVKAWIQHSGFISLVRTTELISAIEAGAGVKLTQSDTSVALRPGDEALLITLSFGVLIAWAEGKIPPLPEDWRCLLLTVEAPHKTLHPVQELAVAEDLKSEHG